MRLPRHAEIWLPGYIRNRLGASAPRRARVWLTIADHYEPFWSNNREQVAGERVQTWRRRWPEIAARHQDSTGRAPRYTFFYPQEEYRPGLLEPLAEMTAAGIADVEVHIHHDGEGRQDFIERISRFTATLRERHGLLHQERGRVVFGFIHGNWALDNSRPDGRWCGLNDEITLLRELGCYADFTMPCGPLPMQAHMLNTIYWAKDDPVRPKSYDWGVPLEPGREAAGDLLMIPGPFGIRWRERLKPRLETGELAAYDPPTRYRVRRWLALAPRIGGDIFIKLFTHGAQERNIACLLAGGLDALFGALRAECESRGWQLRYATAWELYQAVRAAAVVDEALS